MKELLDMFVVQNYYTQDVSHISCWYLLDPTASIEELVRLSELACEAFGGYDDFLAFCLENYVKIGVLYCYTFEPGTRLIEKDLSGFNFETIWIIKDGKARLKIFES
ncbi:MAG: hypothetical protein ACOYIA_00530 [Eubacteriales bacterium]